MLTTVRSAASRSLRTKPTLSRLYTRAAVPIAKSPLIHRKSFAPVSLPRSTVRTMSHDAAESAARPEPDRVLQDIADYVHNYKVDSELAFETARLCLIDTIGCGLEGLRFEACARLMGPVVEGTIVPNGVCTLRFSADGWLRISF
jgi:2-methylcitrate dehydratase